LVKAMQFDPNTLVPILGLVTGILLGYFFATREFDIVKTILYSAGVSVGVSILIGLITGGLWSTVFLIVLVILLIVALPVGYYVYSRGMSIEELINIVAESGLLATTGIPMIALIVLIVLGGILVVTGVIVLYYSITFFIKFGLPLIVGAVASRIVFELISM